MEQNNNHTRKLPGFYIALCCCVIAIGAAGFIAQRMESQSTNALTTVVEETEAPEQAYEPEQLPEAENAVMSSQTIEVSPVETQPAAEKAPEAEAAMADFALDNPDMEASPVSASAKEPDSFASPVPGETVLENFSDNTLRYNNVYCDWRAHNGIDLEAAVGCSVNAAAGGTVCKITDSSNGKEITLQHDNGYSTVYAQLGEISVSEGDKVEAGSVIGTIGEPKGENVAEPHLHFEIRRDGKPLNPEDY